MNVIKPLIGLFLLLYSHVAHGPAGLPRVDPGVDEACFVQQTNATRAARGLPTLPVSASLTGQALSHTQAMAVSNSLYHSTADQYPGNWLGLGENVGAGPTCDDVEQAFLASPHHYENIVDPKWTTIGVGVGPRSDGTGIWVTVGFEQWQATATPPATTPPGPAPTPAAPTPAASTPPTARTTAPAPARKAAVPAPSSAAVPTPPKASQATQASQATLPSPSLPPAAAPLVQPAGTPARSVTPSSPASLPATTVPGVLAAAKASRGVLGLGVAMVLCLAVGAAWGIRDRRRR